MTILAVVNWHIRHIQDGDWNGFINPVILHKLSQHAWIPLSHDHHLQRSRTGFRLYSIECCYLDIFFF